MRRENLPGGFSYLFTDSRLGLLGRLNVVDAGTGQTRIDAEVNGVPGDGLTDAKLAGFRPVALELMQRIEMGMG